MLGRLIRSLFERTPSAPPLALRNCLPAGRVGPGAMKLAMVQKPPVVSPLNSFAANVTSQGGEDGILKRIFEIVPPAAKLCVEFGAWDGKRFSNTYNLITHAGWDGILIEADARRFEKLRATYQDNRKVQLLNRFVGWDTSGTSLDALLAQCQAPERFGLLSIDVDGNDYYIWESVQRHRPDVVCVEFNPTIPNDVYFVQERSLDVNQGCSLLALAVLGREKGYELACATACNGIFVRDDIYPRLDIADNSLDTIYRPLMDGRIFHGYDGTIHVAGMDRLIWQDMPLDPQQLQLLPAEQRRWVDARKA